MKRILKSKSLGYLHELDWILTRFEINGLSLAEARSKVSEVIEDEHRLLKKESLRKVWGKQKVNISHEYKKCPHCGSPMLPVIVGDDEREEIAILGCRKCRYSEVV